MSKPNAQNRHKPLLQAANAFRLNALLGVLFALGMTAWGLLQHKHPWWTWLPPAVGGLWLTWFSLNAIRSSDPDLRARLRQRARVDLRAAKRLRSLVEGDLKALSFVKSRVPERFAPAEQAGALQAIEVAEQQTRSELVEVQALIEELQR